VLDSLDDYSRIRGIAEPLAMIYQKAGRADSALLIYQRILIKSDTFTNNQITSFSKLFAAQMEYEQEVREQQLQLQYRKTIQKRNLMIFIGSGVLLISFILILILRLRLEQQKKKRVEAEKKHAVLEKQTADLKVEAQEKELALKVMNLLKKEEFNVELTNRLIELQKKAGEENIKSEIVGLINTLQRESGERMWDEFEVRFRQVHSGFYERLLINYPDLTANELKICALLRLNLSTKEICELTGQRTVSLDVARSRLRKKLGLTSSQTNLVTFLTQI
jgi:DNA-binding CsgD family transcriptional regulator